MDDVVKNPRVMLIGAALVAAVALGFGISKLTGGRGPAPESTNDAASAHKPVKSLAIPDTSLAIMGIALETVTPGTLEDEVQAPGTVSSAANGQAQVSARASGVIIRLNKRLGDDVTAGEVLALVASRDANSMASELATADAKLKLAESEWAREKSLYEQKVTPRQEFEAAQAQLNAAKAEAARARSSAAASGVIEGGQALAVVSPIAGRITAANAQLGAYVDPATELFHVASSRDLLIEASVSAADARRIAAGDLAKVTMPDGTGQDAKVLSVTSALDKQTRAATVSLAFTSTDQPPTSGEFVEVRIFSKAVGHLADGFVVVADAVQSIDGHDVVFVHTSEGFRVSEVIVGRRNAGRVVIVSGLKSGDVIATRNAFFLKAELGKGAEDDE